MSESLQAVLMRRDGLTATEADSAVNEMRESVQDWADPTSCLNPFEEFQAVYGLEPDYIEELL
jgi:hypothetical protein